MIRLPPTSTLFPYTTLFRSHPHQPLADRRVEAGVDERDVPVVDVRTVQLDVPAAADHGEVVRLGLVVVDEVVLDRDRKSTRLNSSHMSISYAVFCLKKKKKN